MFDFILNPHKSWVVLHPLYQTTNQGELNTAHLMLVKMVKELVTTVDG